MIEQTVFILLVVNFIFLFLIISVLRRWQKQGILTEKKLALMLTGYFSVSTIIISLPVLQINLQVTFIIDAFFLIIFWSVGYPWFRWLYRYIASTK